ncbi:CLPTM1 [Cordylochernes scorpioides]|uniref:CLPTM1 n=1 Tax=Cordylochernes scorpioides TaxID=51811 RepID=A0ABY6K9N2_9ARAC|nr:CLPTM1 [Cordylochernes scorpioides]
MLQWSPILAKVQPHQRVRVTKRGSDTFVGENQQPQQQQQQQISIWSVLKGIAIRALIVYLVTSLLRRGGGSSGGESGAPSAGGPMRHPSSNMYPNGTLMDFFAYISEREHTPDFLNELVWSLPGITYGDWTGGPNGNSIYDVETSFPISEHVQNNGSVWLHVYLVKYGNSPDPSDKGRYHRQTTVHKVKRLNKYKKKRYHRTQNLLTGETAATPDMVQKAEDNTVEILSHWHPNITVNLIDDHTAWVRGHVPPPLDEYVEFDPVTNKYLPILYVNDYWNLMRDYQPINSTVHNLPLRLTFQPLTLFRWQLYTAQAMRSRWGMLLGQEEVDEEDQDSLKETFLETSPVLLGLTFLVSIVHSVFEFLAFKNDIQFWKNRKSLEGLSVRSVFFNVFQSFVVLLYVLDNDTNMVIRISVFVGLLIELWKIHKVLDVSLDRTRPPLLGFIPRVMLSDKGSYVDSSTKQYDVMAFRYLSWALFPLIGVYAVYSLLYLEHKGWYSWVLSMLYGFLLTFGFIMMTPQLFINYKLKSVAHLPWRMLTYKFLNTFIDDIFAFVMKMPTMYRLGCFRDDLVFFIYLYQRYIYRVDYKRVNEFGISGEMEESTDAVVATTAATIQEEGNSKKDN